MKYYLSILILGCVNFIGRTQINTPPTASVPFGTNMYYHGQFSLPTNLPTTGMFGHAQHAADAYNDWKSNFVEVCNTNDPKYRVKFDNTTLTVSEGIGYGMLLSAYAGDQDLFDGLWNYYEDYKNTRGLMHWQINGCANNIGVNGATDADLDAAMALIVANRQWPGQIYRTPAYNLITSIRNHEIHPAPSYQTSNGDGWLLGNSTCRNPSYQSPGYYKVFGVFTGHRAFWTAVRNASNALLNNNEHPSTGLVTNWCNSSGTPNDCNNLGQPVTQYGFDACRNPWRMATDAVWFDAPNSVSRCRKIADYIEGVISNQGIFEVKGPINYDGSGSGLYHNATFVATWAASLIGADTVDQNIINQMYDRTRLVEPNANYFGATLRVLTLFMMTGNFWNPMDVCDADLIITSVPIPANLYKAGRAIKSTGTIENYSTVIFRAGNSVSLDTSFHCDTGSVFSADIKKCLDVYSTKIVFNGVNDYLDGFNMSSTANSGAGTVAIYLDFDENANSTEYVACSNNYSFRLYRKSNGDIQIVGENHYGNIVLNMSTTDAPCISAGSYYILSSWNLSSPGSAQIIVNDHESDLNIATFTASPVDWSQTDYTIGATFAGSLKMHGTLNLFYLNTGNYIDFSDISNIRKFHDEFVEPEFIGFNGELPLGSMPEIFLYHTPVNWHYSKGLYNLPFVIH